MACPPTSQAFVYDDGANLTFFEISPPEAWAASHPGRAMPNPTLSMNTLAGGRGEVGATINPALLTRHHGSSGILRHDAPMQQP